MNDYLQQALAIGVDCALKTQVEGIANEGMTYRHLIEVRNIVLEELEV